MKETKIFCMCSSEYEVMVCKLMLKYFIDKNPNVEYIPLNIQNYYLSPYINEIAGVIYLYENQKLLGDAKHIGICHYRRIYNDLNDDYINFLKENENNFISGCIRIDEALTHKQNAPILNTIFRTYSECTKIDFIEMINDFIKLYPEYDGIKMTHNIDQIENYDYFMPERNIVILNRNKFIQLSRFYTLFVTYLVETSTGKKINKDTFEYFLKDKCLQVEKFCDENYNPIFGFKNEIIDINEPIPYRTVCKRHFGYLCEFITAWFLLRMLGDNYKVCDFRADNYILDYADDDHGYRKLILDENFDESTLEGWDE